MYICWFLTNKCNLNCPYCFAIKDYSKVSFEKAKQIGNAIIASNPNIVVLTGGEPLLVPYLFKLIDFLSNHLKLSITTNSLLFPFDFIKKIINKVSYISISLNTLEESTAQNMMASSINIKRQLWAINEIVRFKIPLKINTLITSKNYNEIKNIGHFLNSFDRSSPLVWKLIKIHKNPFISRDLSNFFISIKKFNELVDKIKFEFPKLEIIPCFNEDFDQKYILITSTGEIILPSRNYSICGNILNSLPRNLLNGIELENNMKLIGMHKKLIN